MCMQPDGERSLLLCRQIYDTLKVHMKCNWAAVRALRPAPDGHGVELGLSVAMHVPGPGTVGPSARDGARDGRSPLAHRARDVA